MGIWRIAIWHTISSVVDAVMEISNIIMADNVTCPADFDCIFRQTLLIRVLSVLRRFNGVLAGVWCRVTGPSVQYVRVMSADKYIIGDVEVLRA